MGFAILGGSSRETHTFASPYTHFTNYTHSFNSNNTKRKHEQDNNTKRKQTEESAEPNICIDRRARTFS